MAGWPLNSSCNAAAVFLPLRKAALTGDGHLRPEALPGAAPACPRLVRQAQPAFPRPGRPTFPAMSVATHPAANTATQGNLAHGAAELPYPVRSRERVEASCINRPGT